LIGQNIDTVWGDQSFILEGIITRSFGVLAQFLLQEQEGENWNLNRENNLLKIVDALEASSVFDE